MLVCGGACCVKRCSLTPAVLYQNTFPSSMSLLWSCVLVFTETVEIESQNGRHVPFLSIIVLGAAAGAVQGLLFLYKCYF